MKNNDMLKKMKKGICVFLATTFIGSYAAPTFAKENDSVKKYSYEYYSLEDAKEAAAVAEVDPSFEGEKVEIGENNLKGYKVGCYVSVNGRGNGASDGSGMMGRFWNNEKMLIVGVRENRAYPYACAIVDDDPGTDDVMAWFTEDNLEYYVKETIEVVDATKGLKASKKDDGGFTITSEYTVPEGYVFDPDTLTGTKTTYVSPVYSDASAETISSTYKISLK